MAKATGFRYRQKGVSSAGWIIIFGIFALLIVSFLKVFPMYYGHFRVEAALKAVAEDTSVDSKSKREIWKSLQRRLNVDGVNYISRENVKMSRKDGKTTVTVSYEVTDDYIGNLFIGGKFSESVVIDR